MFKIKLKDVHKSCTFIISKSLPKNYDLLELTAICIQMDAIFLRLDFFYFEIIQNFELCSDMKSCPEFNNFCHQKSVLHRNGCSLLPLG